MEITTSYITTLTGDANTIMDWRCIHDVEKGIPAHAFRGTLADIYPTLVDYNQKGYGIFCCINSMDGRGRELINVDFIRTHVVDLDNVFSSEANYQKAISSNPLPHFAVQTSPNKYHVYWLVEPYKGNDFYSLQQRKFRQLYDGDRSVVDASRVLRVPGFNHLKDPVNPFMVTCWNVGTHPRHTCTEIETNLNHVNIFTTMQSRSPLGTAEMQAPDVKWLEFAMSLMDPNDMTREEWLSMTASIKQAGWSLMDEAQLFDLWKKWCGQYSGDDDAENLKLWNSIKDTEVGWGTIERRTTVKAYMQFGHKEAPEPQVKVVVNETNEVRPADEFAEILGPQECEQWFENCYFIEREGKIFSNTARFMNSTQFDGKYGGKNFIITSTGKTTDLPWKAALRSTCWTIPKVDHIRFLPTEPSFAIIEDDLGRKGLNTYITAKIKMREGDVTPWLNHVDKIIPDKEDQKIWFDYLAHCIKYPGYKIPWAPMLQSMEGVGKSVFFDVLSRSLGDPYVYRPKASELVSSGSTFNAWMRSKLMIVVDEIKIDERRELVEILKPMISEARVEVQSKGVDQDMEDNVANWLFFSNYKDAIPINRKGRRYTIFYSAIQTYNDLMNAGMGDAYFNDLWHWLEHENGFEYVTQWFMNYPVEKGGLPVRAPHTSSYEEAIQISRSPMEVVIYDCIADTLPGFKGGYISSTSVVNRVKMSGIRTPSARAVQTVLEGMGYVQIGKCQRPYAQEDVNHKPVIYAKSGDMDVNLYGKTQGYE